jgi:hypothetical protein
MVPTLRVGIYPLTLRVIPWQTQSVWNGVTTLSGGDDHGQMVRADPGEA